MCIAGSEEVPSYDGSSVMKGNEGGGYAKITYVGYQNYSIAKGQEYAYSGTEQRFQVDTTGVYKLEVWGAQGGSGGNGGYSSGYVQLQKGEEIYVYVGGKGLDTANVGANAQKGGFNGGGDSGIPSYYSSLGTICGAFGSGGGATDIRRIKASEGSWYDVEHEDWSKDKSLLSRIIVAGGGRTEVGQMMGKQEAD